MGIVLNHEDLKGLPHIYKGFNAPARGWISPRPVNSHVHFRDPDDPDELPVFTMAVTESAKVYRWVTAMPNLNANRIRSGDQARIYRERILEQAHKTDSRFDVVVPFYVEEGLDLGELEKAFRNNDLLAGKLYPKNGTTNSSYGVDFRRIKTLFPLFALMEKHDRILLVHAEMVTYSTGRLIEDRLREQRAIRTVEKIFRAFPQLRIVFEHISSRHSIAACKRWKEAGHSIEATIAPQYLLWDSTALFEGGMNPARFSIPILKDYQDRMALIAFMVEGGGMLGTDSAPHAIWKKSKPMCCPGGVFNEPVSIHVYFHIFRQYGGEDWFEKFVDFACRKAPRFYGLPEAADKVLIRERPWSVDEAYVSEGASVLHSVIPLLAGDRVPTRLMPV